MKRLLFVIDIFFTKKHILILALLSSNFFYTQEAESETISRFNKIVSVPNSPEATAFTKYGNVSVNMNEGRPEIEAPLYTIKGRELDLPIRLTYDASGIKVNQIASNVGLGWNLDVGGRISRQVRGLPDYGGGYESIAKDPLIRQKVVEYRAFDGEEYPNYEVLYNQGDDFSTKASKVKAFYNFLRDVSMSNIDIDPDYFSLNVLGLNEKLWQNIETEEYVALQNNDIKVYIDSDYDEIYGWKIIDKNGVQYFFGRYNTVGWDYTDSSGSNHQYISFEKTNKTNEYAYQKTQYNTWDITYNSSWLLTKIISATGKDIYDFVYTNNLDYNNNEGEKIISQITHSLRRECWMNEYADIPWGNTLNSNHTEYKFTQQFVKSIFHNDKEVVKFEYIDREDIENGSNKALGNIRIYADNLSNQQPVKDILFEYSYFGDTENAQSFHDKRLKLDKIKMDDGNNNEYTFDYIRPFDVPSRESGQKDLFGYYNGNPVNENIPFEKWTGHLYNNVLYELDGRINNISEQHTKIGTLNKIYYPTGGYTEFEYENHQKKVSSSETVLYPGLRIKKISNYTNSNIPDTTKEFQYVSTYNSPTSSSLIKTFTPITYYEEEVERFLGFYLSDCGSCVRNDESCLYSLRLHRFSTPANMTNFPYIKYTDVIEENKGESNQGYTHYKYWNNSEVNGWHNDYSSTAPFFGNYVSSFQNGKLKEKKIFDKDGVLVYKEELEYSVNDSINRVILDELFYVRTNPYKAYTYKVCSIASGSFDVYNKTCDYQGLCGYIENYYVTTCPLVAIYSDELCSSSGVDCFGLHDNRNTFENPPQSSYGVYEYNKIKVEGNFGYLKKKTKTEYLNGGEIKTITENYYLPNTTLLKSTKINVNNNNEIKTIYTYPQELVNNGIATPAEVKLFDDHRLSTPIMIEKKKDDVVLSKTKNNYKIYTDTVLLDNIEMSKGENDFGFERRIKYNQYDGYGNPCDISLQDGTRVSYIWGYNHSKPIAKLENIEYSQIPNSLLTPLLNFDYYNNNNEALVELLNELREGVSNNVMVSTYTYLPLVGVHTITDSKGNVQTYDYNDNKKLEFIKNIDDTILKQYVYNYKPKNVLSGGGIKLISDDGSSMQFEVIVSQIIGGSGNYSYTWSSNAQSNGGNTATSYYNCVNLNGDALNINCLVIDLDYDFSINLSKSIFPESCNLEGDISLSHIDNEITFTANVTGGSGSYTYNWMISSGDNSGIGVVSTNNNVYTINYDCTQLMDEIRVYCHVVDTSFGNDLHLNKGVIGDCPLDFLDFSIVSSGSNNQRILTCTPSSLNDPNLTYSWDVDFEAIQFGCFYEDENTPYIDENSVIYIPYNCLTGCDDNKCEPCTTGLMNVTSNLILPITLSATHPNGNSSSLLKEAPITNTCQAGN